jgi:pimeloyl-ACP methyl ester carboxylesterase
LNPLIILLALCAALAGCELATPTEGSLRLSFGGPLGRTLQPPLDMNPASYNVTGLGPGGTSFQRLGVTGASTTVDSLAPGSWQVTVEAFNSGSQLIGTGSAGAVVAAGAVTAALIVVSPLAGEGLLQLTVSWPSGQLANPSVTGTLTPVGGSPTALGFSLAGDSASHQNPALASGYYALSLVLREGAAVVWGRTESVRILAGQTTTGLFALTAADLDPGSLQVTIQPNLQNPFQISFQGQSQALAPGTDMTVSATLSPMPPNPSYQWYLDGSPLPGATASTVTIGGSLPVGANRLDLLVLGGGALAAGGVSFRISPFARTPVFFVHGYGLTSADWNALRAYLQQQAGYPPQLLRAVDLVPNTGANVEAAVNQLQPAIEEFLSELNAYLALNQPGVPSKTKVDLVSHSMGSLSGRWYAARLAPQRVRRWLSLAGANHGTSLALFAGQSDGGQEDMYPAFAASELESLIQFQLNGSAAADVDETPYGLGSDAGGVSVVPADSTRSIYYATIAADGDDIWIDPDSSVQLDGAGGLPFTLPGDLPAAVLSPGNFRMTNGIGHDPMVADPQTMRLVGLLLGL